jgi:type II secretory pathway pseudopilin PulG
MARLRKRPGFTLIETALSLSVLSTILYLAAVSFLNLAPKYKLEKAAWEIAAALNAARMKAILEEADFKFTASPSGYRLEKRDDPAKEWLLEERRSFEGVSVSANNAPVFTAEGAVAGLATFTVENPWGGYKITLSITGRVKTTRLY